MSPSRSPRSPVRSTLGLVAALALATLFGAGAAQGRPLHGHHVIPATQAIHKLRTSSPTARTRPIARLRRHASPAARPATPLLLEAAFLDRAPAHLTLAFLTPLPGHGVNSRFGMRQLSFEPKSRMHDGVDMAAPIGVPIHAAALGLVARTGVSESYGRFVEIRHAGGLSTFYAHMSRTAPLRIGSLVLPGAVLGWVGSTGHSTGPHLHFEVRKDGKALNPLLFMGHSFERVADLPQNLAKAPAPDAAPRPLRHRHGFRVLASLRGGRALALVGKG
jgi:murein DD-endopeptidase MepM/ murein hydrolase activator NlpD